MFCKIAEKEEVLKPIDALIITAEINPQTFQFCSKCKLRKQQLFNPIRILTQEVNTIVKNFLDCCIFLAVPLSFIVGCASLNYSGFCFDKMRYLSDEEKFRILFEAGNNRETVPIKTVIKEAIHFKSYERIKYEGFEQFMESNPNCCAIDPGGPYDVAPSNFWDRIAGYDSGEVIVFTYIVHYIDENGERKSQKIKTENVLQNCGRARYD